MFIQNYLVKQTTTDKCMEHVGYVGTLTNQPFLTAVPALFRISTTIAPATHPNGLSKQFNSAESRKLRTIEQSIKEVCKDLNIDDSCHINLRVDDTMADNARMVGNLHSLQGPVLFLGHTYFENFVPPSMGQDLGFEAWLNLLDGIPNDPVELGHYLETCTLEERQNLEKMLKKFKSRLSQEELSYLLAHEIAHAKHHHQLTNLGAMLMVMTAFKALQMGIKKMGVKGSFAFAFSPLASLCGKAFSRYQETQADQESTHSETYLKGMIRYHKRELLNALFKPKGLIEKWTTGSLPSFEKKATQLIQSTDWNQNHPNAAKRLQHAVELSTLKEHPNTDMSKVAWVIAGLGFLKLTKDLYQAIPTPK